MREERAALLPGHVPGGDTARDVARRAQDWAQPFPEWGLAGAAAMVVGPRSLTRGAHLDGRVFLHSYEPAHDPDGTLLGQLLSAPVVVAHWISSQYRLSTAAPDVLGAGDKTTHNVVGDVGVLSGAHGDLRTGLPWQAVHAADPSLLGRRGGPGAGRDVPEARHEPLRLLVVVHAAAAVVEQALGRDRGLVDLVDNGWVRLVVSDPQDGGLRLRTRSGRWVPCEQVVPVPGTSRRAPAPLG